MKQTHKQKILALFKENEGHEINHRRIVVDLGISEYTGRITDLRRDFGCTHGEGTPCTSDEHIINTRKNYYKYLRRGVQTVTESPKSAPLPIFDDTVKMINSAEWMLSKMRAEKRLEENPNDLIAKGQLRVLESIKPNELEGALA